MRRNWRTAVYAAAGAALMIALLAAPGVWATPGQNLNNQTIPTRTPTAQPNTPQPNTPQPQPATPDPGATATVAPVETVGAGTPVDSATAQPSALGLTLVADRQQVWPGATVTFTLTVTNLSAAPLQQVTVADALTQGLEPGEVVSGNATWDGATLKTTAATLAAGEKLVIVYTAQVAAAAPGQAMTSRVTATAAGGVTATASLTLGFPPSELPVTGGCVEP